VDIVVVAAAIIFPFLQEAVLEEDQDTNLMTGIAGEKLMDFCAEITMTADG